MKAIAAALAAARAEFSRAEKDGKNPMLKNRYATLNSIIDACDEALGRHGLTFWQPIIVLPTGMSVVRTVLFHIQSGEQLECDVPLSHEMGNKGVNPMQAMGSAITYGRRYGLESLLGIMREDDDGNGAYAPRQNGQQYAAKPPQHAPRYEQPAPKPAAQPATMDAFEKWAVSAADALGANKYAVISHLAKRFSIAGDMSQKWAGVKSMWSDPDGKHDIKEELRAYDAQRNADAVAELSTNA